jgi:flavin reductase (DIM6/NTAB) family NADH-FMN oxidoreductase RutF
MKKTKWTDAVLLASPYSLALVVSLDPSRMANVMAASWWCYLSAKPKLLGVAVAPERYTHICIRHSREFTLCFPSKEIALPAWKCGQLSGRRVNKPEELGLKLLPAAEVKAPLLKGSTAAFECTLTSQYKTGDHTFFVGEIVASHGDANNPEHLYTRFFDKAVSISHHGKCDWKLDETLGIPGELSR